MSKIFNRREAIGIGLGGLGFAALDLERRQRAGRDDADLLDRAPQHARAGVHDAEDPRRVREGEPGASRSCTSPSPATSSIRSSWPPFRGSRCRTSPRPTPIIRCSSPRSTRWSRWTTSWTSGRQSGRYDEVTNKYAIEKNFWNGHYWAVAYNIDIRPIYYRRDLLEAKGIAPPKTWDEFQAAAIALNDPANEVYGVVYPAGDFHIAQHFYMAFMFQAGGGILDKDGKLIFGTDGARRQHQGAHLHDRLRHQA